VETVGGELAKGWATDAPYDLILLDGAFEEIPATFIKQLNADGRVGGAIVDRGVTRLVVGQVSGGALGLRSLVDADVDPLPGFERPRVFTF
jgi:protein-L-isoaspartate(D-aspartate) O-methyltransferase